MKIVLLLLATLQMTMFNAVASSDLYSGEVVVPSQSENDRSEAVPDALIQVLQKLSGKREMPPSPALDSAINNADKIMRSYRYESTDHIGPGGLTTPQVRLVVEFLQPEVDTLIQQAGLPRWQKGRPPIQIWVIIEENGNRKLKPLEFTYAWLAMEDIASMRGLRISWPELDEEELQLVDMRLVWGGFTDYLVERGAPEDGVAIIAARREGPDWVLRWSMASGAQTWNWRNSDQELMYALAAGIHQMTDSIAAGNTIAVSEQGTQIWDITIGSLNNADDYARCLAYLQSLSIVTDVEIVGAKPGRVHFRLQLNAAEEHLAAAFTRGTVLLPANAGSEVDYDLLH